MLQKLSFAVISTVLVLMLAGCTSSEPERDKNRVTPVQKSPKDTRQYATLTLENGIEVILVEDTSSEIAAVSLALGVGSFQNPESQQGLAHYLEHMLFLGTEKYPDPNTLQKFIDHNSGSWNAYTARDHTNYFFSLPTAKLDEALDMFSDYFKAPRFDLEYSDKERNAVDSEWSMGRNQDGRIMNYLNGYTGNPAHPASRLAVGNLETLSDKDGSILNEELVAFFDKYYSANIMKLVMVSNKPLAEQEVLARKHFSAVTNKNTEMPAITVPGFTRAEMGKKIYYAPVMDLKMMILRFPIPNNSDLWRSKPNRYVVSLLASEEQGTVAQRLREQNLVKSLSAQVNPTSNDFDGSLDIYIDLTDEGVGKRDDIIASVFSYIDLVKKEGVDEKYFIEQKAIYEKKLANLEMQQPLKTAIGLSSSLLKFDAQWVIVNPYVYESFNPSAVSDVLSYLTPERARIWFVGKNEPAEKTIPYHEGQYSIADTSTDDIARWKTMAKSITFNLPAENDLFSQDAATVVAATIKHPELIRSDESVEVWLTHSEGFQDQKGRIDISLNGDLFVSSVRNHLLATVMEKVLQSQQLSLIDRAGLAGIGLSFQSKSNDFTVSLSEFNVKHEKLAGQVFSALNNWSVTDAEFAKARDSLIQDLDNREKAPPSRQIFGLLDRQLLTKNWSREAEKLAAESLTREQLLAFQKMLWANHRLRVFAYGNYSQKTVLDIVDKVESLLPKKISEHTYFKRATAIPKAGELLDYREDLSGHTDNAIVQLYVQPQQSYLGLAQVITLDALTSNSFFTQLRTNEQLGYVVGTAPKSVDRHPGIMFYVQSNNTALPAVSQRIDRFRAEFLAELEATEEAVFEQIKQSLLDQLTKQPLDFDEEMGPLLRDFYRGRLEFNSKAQLIAAFDNVNKADIVEFYKTVVLGDAGMKAVVQLKGTDYVETPFAPITFDANITAQ